MRKTNVDALAPPAGGPRTPFAGPPTPGTLFPLPSRGSFGSMALISVRQSVVPTRVCRIPPPTPIRGNTTMHVQGPITGTGPLTKIDGGVLLLSGQGSYTGPTNVNNGTLNLIGSIANSPVTVAINGRLSGTGTLGSSLAITGGTLAPGDSTTTALGMLSITGDLQSGNLNGGNHIALLATPEPGRALLAHRRR